MTEAKQAPVVEGLFSETDAGPRLLGSRCEACASVYFPPAPACKNPGCEHGRVVDVEFGARGKLWSYTIQYYPPPAPFRFDEPFTPFAIGLVDLPEGLRVVAMMSAEDPEALRIGAPVELVIEPMYTDDQGAEVLTWKFRLAQG